jgi:hypothetical protein
LGKQDTAKQGKARLEITGRGRRDSGERRGMVGGLDGWQGWMRLQEVVLVVQMAPLLPVTALIKRRYLGILPATPILVGGGMRDRYSQVSLPDSITHRGELHLRVKWAMVYY